eukprot:2684081-Rhodomonas_salina.1
MAAVVVQEAFDRGNGMTAGGENDEFFDAAFAGGANTKGYGEHGRVLLEGFTMCFGDTTPDPVTGLCTSCVETEVLLQDVCVAPVACSNPGLLEQFTDLNENPLCVCAEGTNGNQCVQCLAGSYCPTRGGVSLSCPTGTVSQQGSSALADCQCAVGTIGVHGSGECTPCAPCPEHHKENVACFGENASLCVPCDTPGTFCTGGLEQACPTVQYCP